LAQDATKPQENEYCERKKDDDGEDVEHVSHSRRREWQDGAFLGRLKMVKPREEARFPQSM
jgi:hypothetical protein